MKQLMNYYQLYYMEMRRQLRLLLLRLLRLFDLDYIGLQNHKLQRLLPDCYNELNLIMLLLQLGLMMYQQLHYMDLIRLVLIECVLDIEAVVIFLIYKKNYS
jgi:hypothetical protein